MGVSEMNIDNETIQLIALICEGITNIAKGVFCGAVTGFIIGIAIEEHKIKLIKTKTV
jgi:predicted ester cyclase